MTPDQQNTSKGRWMFVPDTHQVVPKKPDAEWCRRYAFVMNKVIPTGHIWPDIKAMLATSPSPPEVREVTEAMIAQAIDEGIQREMWRGGAADGQSADHYRSAARAVLRRLAPSDQDVTEKQK